MPFTKRQTKYLARAISEIKEEETRKAMAELIGGVCAEENNLFNWERWQLACEGKPFRK